MKFNNLKFISSKFKFLFFLLLIGIIIGMTIYTNLGTDLKETIDASLNELINNLEGSKQNSIIYHISILSIFTLLSCFIFGIILYFGYYLYEGISIGFLISALIHCKKIKGIYYSLVFITINKSIFIILLTYMLYISIIYLYDYIQKKFKINNFKNYFARQAIVILLIFINDILLYFIGNKLISMFI